MEAYDFTTMTKWPERQPESVPSVQGRRITGEDSAHLISFKEEVMCDNCTAIRRENWQEVRDLLNYKRPNKGPLSQNLSEWIEEYKAENDELISDAEIDGIRAEMIAVRCAVIASCSPGTRHHKNAISIILGEWAGSALQTEFETRIKQSPLGRMLFGIEDDDE